MLRYALCFLFGLVLAGTARQPRAQAVDSLVVERSAPAPVSAATAVGLEYLFPTLGHAYAGDWARGVVPFLVSVAGGVLVVSEALDCQCVDGPEVAAGTLLIIGGRVWGLYSAYRTAADRNQQAAALARASRPEIRARGLGLSLSLPL